MAVAVNEINAGKYGRLLAKTLPAVIKTEAENERMLAEIERLMDKGERMTPEELVLLELMSQLVETFEKEAYTVADAPPHRVLQHLMESNELSQVDLLPIFGGRGRVSEVVNGKRGISKAQAKALAGFFHVSADLFL